MLYDSKVYEQVVEKGGEAAILIGHTRKKTIGEVSIKNAHPFDFADEGICGVHNGTLNGTARLDGHDWKKVDSEILYEHLSKNGPEDTFNRTEGAWACVWWNDRDKTLNFIRNNERPLYFTWSKDMEMMFWASEIWMFGAIRRRIDLWDGGEDKTIYHALPINTLWSFKVNPKATGKEPLMRLAAPKVIDLFERPTPATRTVIGFHGGTSYHHNQNNRSHLGQRVNRWREESPGNHVRNDDSKATKALEDKSKEQSKAKGGEVTDPFPLAKTGLNDAINDLFGLEDGEKTTPIANVNFLTTSAKRTGSNRDSQSSKRSKRKTLSLPAMLSRDSQRNSNVVPLFGSEQSSKTILNSTSKDSLTNHNNSPQSSIRMLCKGVSFRKVAGINYITDNRTKDEYTFEDVYMHTGGICSCCKEFLHTDLSNVGEFLSKNMVLCKTCLDDPSEKVLIKSSVLSE